MPTSAPLLEVDRVDVAYGHIPALRDLSLSLPRGSAIAVLGPNGAGKTTLLKTVSGLTRPTSGHVRFDGTDITRHQPHRIARLGIAHVPEGRRVLAPLTVDENLLLAARAAGAKGRDDARRRADEAYELFPRLVERRQLPSGVLSGGEQQMLAIGRAFVSDPALIIMDEPSMGLAPIVVREIYEMLMPDSPLRERMSVLLAEQSANLTMDVADYSYVLSKGSVVLEGTPSELTDRPELLAAYLGGVSAPHGTEGNPSSGRAEAVERSRSETP